MTRNCRNFCPMDGRLNRRGGACVYTFSFEFETGCPDRAEGFRKPAGYEWVNPRDFPDRALPSVMRKVAMKVLEESPRRRA